MKQNKEGPSYRFAHSGAVKVLDDVHGIMVLLGATGQRKSTLVKEHANIYEWIKEKD